MGDCEDQAERGEVEGVEFGGVGEECGGAGEECGGRGGAVERMRERVEWEGMEGMELRWNDTGEDVEKRWRQGSSSEGNEEKANDSKLDFHRRCAARSIVAVLFQS